MQIIRATWDRSIWYRVALSAAIIYFILRMAVQIYFLFFSSPLDTLAYGDIIIPNDLKDYLEAAQRLLARQDLYLAGKLEHVEFFQYAPSYALLFTIFLPLHPLVTVAIHAILHIAAYVALFFGWNRIFQKLGNQKIAQALLVSLPFWLIFEPFWSDLGYLNIYIPIALVATWLVAAILDEDLPMSLLWLTILLQIKPHWAFAAGVPLLMGNRRFFWKLFAGAVVGYLTIAGITILWVGVPYGWEQYQAYFNFLADLSANFPWRGSESTFLGYNHSVMQTILFFFGDSAANRWIGTLVKVALLVPLLAIAWRAFGKPQDRFDRSARLEMALALYLGAFIWLDMVWELSLGLVIYVYLMATTESTLERAALGLVFVPYALLDPLRLVSYGIFGDAILVNDYILTDPSTFVPLILFVLLVFYTILARRLFQRTA